MAAAADDGLWLNQTLGEVMSDACSMQVDAEDTTSASELILTHLLRPIPATVVGWTHIVQRPSVFRCRVTDPAAASAPTQAHTHTHTHMLPGAAGPNCTAPYGGTRRMA